MIENEKIWVVVAVLAIIFVGIIIYVISTDLKLRKAEKELKELQIRNKNSKE